MQKLATLTGHTMRVLYLAVSPDGQTIITGGWVDGGMGQAGRVGEVGVGWWGVGWAGGRGAPGCRQRCRM